MKTQFQFLLVTLACMLLANCGNKSATLSADAQSTPNSQDNADAQSKLNAVDNPTNKIKKSSPAEGDKKLAAVSDKDITVADGRKMRRNSSLVEGLAIEEPQNILGKVTDLSKLSNAKVSLSKIETTYQYLTSGLPLDGLTLKAIHLVPAKGNIDDNDPVGFELNWGETINLAEKWFISPIWLNLSQQISINAGTISFPNLNFFWTQFLTNPESKLKFSWALKTEANTNSTVLDLNSLFSQKNFNSRTSVFSMAADATTTFDGAIQQTEDGGIVLTIKESDSNKTLTLIRLTYIP